ncbi:HEAT repeat domain-containing protein [Streptomyces sp. MB09-01]|uniref:HEAT repeat domain-containing protein n=1 Tax=Streptomyces sp. MB09-01 TaxID=3028666 RepID=UPI0029B68580|nr:HEAT repeat domain-containing protein [Streptomyces sp. MB09-01]MDX3534325.1 HEAT repeat domain-containing protein [Streptomyces sp. MB09-01]
MPIARDDIISALLPDEPNYEAAAQYLGPEEAPVLADLAESDNVGLASKAASMARFLPADSARAILQRAAAHHDPVVRVAAAASLERQPELAEELAGQLLADPDAGVRKWTLRSLQAVRLAGWRNQVKALAATEQVPFLQELAREVLRQLPP